MQIQPSVQSASYGATFASSVSATGVEQTVARAQLPPVEETSRDSASQNRNNPFLSTDQSYRSSAAQPADAGTQPSAGATSGQDTPSSDATESGSQPDSAKSAETTRQRLQEEADKVVLDQLKARDREVRLHEAAHAAVGGRYAGSPSYQYQRGPDGRNYAVGGEVGISTGAVSGDPQATIEKARVIRAAALAPAEPSSQDRRVAAEAAQLELNARNELRQQEATARAEQEKTREATQAQKQVEEAERKDQAADTTAQEESEVEAIRPDSAATRPVAERDAAEDDDSSEQAEEEPRPNARERLEQILLATGSILQQANRQGLVNPQNPYGKSGYLDIIA